MRRKQKSRWCHDEKGYVDYLDLERHLFAWCLVVHGGIPPSTARTQAEDFYRYEAPTESHRGLIFHDEAWHWAMRKLFGARFWIAHPELASPSADYRHEAACYRRKQ